MCVTAPLTISTLDCIHWAFFMSFLFTMNCGLPERTSPAGSRSALGKIGGVAAFRARALAFA
jgi:hypothetical protein